MGTDDTKQSVTPASPATPQPHGVTPGPATPQTHGVTPGPAGNAMTSREVSDYTYHNSLTWMPTYSGDLSALASLQSCSTNLTRGCDAAAEQLSEAYHRAWANTAPAHCQRTRIGGGTDPAPRAVYTDRLWRPRPCDDGPTPPKQS